MWGPDVSAARSEATAIALVTLFSFTMAVPPNRIPSLER